MLVINKSDIITGLILIGGLIFGGLIFGGAYIRVGLYLE